jgi:hypothetical protein
VIFYYVETLALKSFCKRFRLMLVLEKYQKKNFERAINKANQQLAGSV